MTGEMSKIGPIPVHVLTGFLGSGKTTLLNRLIRHDFFAEAAVVINEFGEVGLDHHLVDRSDDTIIELANGCLCCTVRGQLVDTLEDLVRRKPERIFIETTGLADPGPVLQAIMGTPALRGEIRFAGLVCVYDTLHGIANLKEQREAKLQLQLADTIVLSKLDCCSDPKTAEEEARETINKLNPDCRIVSADIFLVDPVADFSLRAGSSPLPTEAKHPLHHEHDISRHNDRICAVTLTHDAPISRQLLSMFIDLLLSAHGNHVLRLKGLVNIAEESRPLVLQAVRRTPSEFDFLECWPDDHIQTRIVIFLENLDADFVRKLFNGFMNIPTVDAPDKEGLSSNPLAIPGMGGIKFK